MWPHVERPHLGMIPSSGTAPPAKAAVMTAGSPHTVAARREGGYIKPAGP
ncbi:MAG: hypothetical protein QOG44_3212 [Acidimicrobiaceae bacterium]|jgi:hypothetical protein|nr:hypothetical protein [Acidimicrobiaceae bacterium]